MDVVALLGRRLLRHLVEMAYLLSEGSELGGDQDLLDEGHEGAEHDGGDDDDGEGGGHDDLTLPEVVLGLLLVVLGDLEHESKSDGAPDHAPVRDEAELAEGHIPLLGAELEEEVGDPDGHGPAHDDDEGHPADEGDGPDVLHVGLVLRVGEGAEADVGEDEGFGGRPENREGDAGDGLALRRKVVPGVVGHGDAAGEQADDAGDLEELGEEVGEEGDDEEEQGLRHGRVRQEAAPLEQQAAQEAGDEADGDGEDGKSDEVAYDLEGRGPVEGLFLQILDRVEEDNADDVVKDALAVDDREELGLVVVADHGDGGDDVTRAEQGADAQHFEHAHFERDVGLGGVVELLE
mmetsp:Transcript_16362/g.27670  ORF Transcript_16362/g.27670 Transcript_16362/m.27670 type:complete len:349 (-) Transcript_16362:443-1489(-)